MIRPGRVVITRTRSAEEYRLFQVMRDEEYGLAHTVVGLQQKFLSDAFCQRIHRAERLVKQQHLGIIDQSARNLDAAAHAG